MIPNRVAKLLRQTDAPSPHRIGVVESTSPLLVRISPSTTAAPARRLTSYTPTISDVVLVAVTGADRVVLGEVTT